MRWRLLFASAIPAVAAVVLLGVPLGLLAQREVVNAARLRLSAHAAAVGRTVQDRLGDDLPVTAKTVTGLLPPGTSAVVRRPGHPPVQAGPEIPAPRLISTVPLQSGTGAGDKPGGAVELTTSRDELDESIYRRWAVVAALAVVGGLIAVLVGRGMARRLGRPLRALADQASRIGAGDLRPSGAVTASAKSTG